ncbi:MAG: hypothetical protein KIT87_10790 [Anaerolineae bacterium]|nr:hypothetical protein [Anaerolineae bacterium]
MSAIRNTDQLFRLFKDFTRQLNRRPAVAQRLSQPPLVLGFHLRDLATALVLDWRTVPLRGQIGQPDLSLNLEVWTTSDAFHQLWLGQLSLAQLIARGRATGDLSLAPGLEDRLREAQPIYLDSARRLGLAPNASTQSPAGVGQWRARVSSLVDAISGAATTLATRSRPGSANSPALLPAPADDQRSATASMTTTPTPDLTVPAQAPVTEPQTTPPVTTELTTNPPPPTEPAAPPKKRGARSRPPAASDAPTFEKLSKRLIPTVEGDAPPRRVERLDQALPTEESPLRLEMLRRMALLRAVETRLAAELQAGRLPVTDLLLSEGQEGVAVGACFALRPTDNLVTTHRGLSHFLARGSDPTAVIAEVYGRQGGLCQGKGGPYNLSDTRVGALATSIIGAATALAVGWGLAAQLRHLDQVTVCFLGEGAMDRGLVHEALTLASERRLPVVFIVVNDQAEGAPAEDDNRRLSRIAQRAVAYDIGNATVDGADVWAVYRSVRAAVRLARSGRGPTLIEARAPRLAGLSDEARVAADPFIRYYNQLVEAKTLAPSDAREIAQAAQLQVDRILERVQAMPAPAQETLTTHVYGPEPAALYRAQPPRLGGREMTLAQAVQEALATAIEADPAVYLIGPSVAEAGPFRTTAGLRERFGVDRVIQAPFSPSVLVGSAVAAAAAGLRPVVDLVVADFLALAADPIINHAAKLRYMTAGQYRVPLVIRVGSGPAQGYGPQLSQSLEAWLASIPGLIIAVPSAPNEAKGLLRTAIRSNNPVLFFEPKALYHGSGLVPEDDYFIPFGVADVKRSGNDCTVVAVGAAVQEALAAAETLAQAGIGVEVIDPRTLVPFDWATVFGSAARTGRLVIVEEAPLTLGWGAEVAAQAATHLFHYLRAPVERVAASSTPLPYSPTLAAAALAGEPHIVAAVRRVMGDGKATR